MLDYSPLDTTSASTAAHTIKAIASKSRSTHPLRGVVACAGISGRYPALDYPVEDFRHILDVNVTGTFVCARETARVMRERGVGGSLVLIASMSGYGVNQVNLPTFLGVVYCTEDEIDGTSRMHRCLDLLCS